MNRAELKKVAIAIADSVQVLLNRITELEEIINKAEVNPDSESTCDPLVDNSYTGQIAQLKIEIKQLQQHIKLTRPEHKQGENNADFNKKQNLGSRNTIGGMLKDNDTGEVSEPTITDLSDFPEDLE